MNLLHRILAFLLRKFWTSCPKCGTKFGGHQPYAESVAYKISPRTYLYYRYVCQACVRGATTSIPRPGVRLKLGCKK
jgi:hypothetical protein